MVRSFGLNLKFSTVTSCVTASSGIGQTQEIATAVSTGR
jgi:hypothetical protein